MAATIARVPAAAVGPTGRVPWSYRLLQEWVAVKYPSAIPLYELRLGPTSAHVVGVHITPALEAMLRTENWYADAVLIIPGVTLIVEAKMQANPSAVGQVLFYSRLALQTPALEQYRNQPIQPVVLFAEEDDAVSNFARSFGVRVEIYSPAWIEDYLYRVQFRNRVTVPAGLPDGSPLRTINMRRQQPPP